MIEKIGKRLQSVILGAVVVLLSAVFILEFGGPQARGCASNLQANRFAARVYGDTISEGDFRAAYVLSGFDRYPSDSARQANLKELTLEALIERNLLARRARELGFQVTDDQVMKRLAKDGTMYLSASVQAPQTFPSGEIPIPVKEDGQFDKEAARKFIQYHLRRSIQEFGDAQIQETLAQRMRELLRSSITVSTDELWQAFSLEKDKVTLKYIRFSPLYYRESLKPNAAELKAWADAHKADIDKEFEAQKAKYQGLPKQVRARHILIKVEDNGDEAAKATALAKAKKALGRARAKEDFAALARELSEDTESAKRGGDLGYNPKGRMVEAFDKAQFALAPGQISDLVESQYGYHIIKVEGTREGNVPVDEVRAEIAENLYRDRRSKELARGAALETTNALKQGQDFAAISAKLNPQASQKPEGDEDEGAQGDSFAPKVQETQAFARGDMPIPGPFDSSPLIKAAFELTKESPLPSQPILLGDDWFVIRLEDRTIPKREELAGEEAQRIREYLLNQKRQESLLLYVKKLRKEAENDGALKINKESLRYSATQDQS